MEGGCRGLRRMLELPANRLVDGVIVAPHTMPLLCIGPSQLLFTAPAPSLPDVRTQIVLVRVHRPPSKRLSSIRNPL